MKQLFALCLGLLVVSCGKAELKPDTAKLNALAADTLAAFGPTPVDTTRRAGPRPAVPAVRDYRTDDQQALRNQKVVLPPPKRIVRKLP